MNPELHRAPRDVRLPGELSLRNVRPAAIRLIEDLRDPSRDQRTVLTAAVGEIEALDSMAWLPVWSLVFRDA